MSIAKFLIVAAVIGFSVHWWKNQKADDHQTADSNSPSGFISVAMPSGTSDNTVVILAPANCPSDGAQRADALADELNRLNIPNVRSSSYASTLDNPSNEQIAKAERAVEILKGEVPAVFINGMGKSNPSVAEVASEYKRTR